MSNQDFATNFLVYLLYPIYSSICASLIFDTFHGKLQLLVYAPLKYFSIHIIK